MLVAGARTRVRRHNRRGKTTMKKLLHSVSTLADEQGHSVDIKKLSYKERKQLKYFFETYENACKLAGVQAAAPKLWNREQILDEIRRRYHACGQTPDKAVNLRGLAKRFFPSWQQAIAAAGFEYDNYIETTTGRVRWSKEKVGQFILKIYTRQISDSTEIKKIYRAARRQFGSLEKAVCYAGLNHSEYKRSIRGWSVKNK